MRNASKLATSALLASGVSAQVVQWGIEKRMDVVPRLKKRGGATIDAPVLNNLKLGGYFVECTIGTPPQKVQLQLDTGSSDIWVPATNASVCTESPSQGGGCPLGTYDYTKSSSVEILSNTFKTGYVDGTSATGDYVSETFGIGNVQVENVTMGVGLDTDIPYGLVGVGYAYNEAVVMLGGQAYNNLPLLLRNENQTVTTAYSLWLNDLEASKGSILFGGIDTDKYVGDLTRVQIQKAPKTNQYTEFTVLMTSITAHSSSGDDTLSSSVIPIPAVLDSGTTATYLPQDLAQQIWTEVGATYSADVKSAVVPCALANSQNYFTFGFGGPGGPAINVSMADLVLPADKGFDAGVYTSGPFNGQHACQFGIVNTTSKTYLIGDTFLRSAYVVYDLENAEIAMAPTDFNATTSNVVPFPSQGATIPSSTPAPSQNAAVQGSTTPPKYNAQAGFTKLNNGGSSGSSGSGSGNNGGDVNAASLVPALDLTKIFVMGASMGLMMVGGGAVLLL